MAVVGQMSAHVRCKVMYRCVCVRHCAVERHTTGIPTKSAEDTNMGSYSVQQFTSPLHDDKRATTPRQQGNLRLTLFQCTQYTWTRNQGSVTSSHAADSVTFAEKVGNSLSRPWSMIVNAVLRHSVALHLHQHV